MTRLLVLFALLLAIPVTAAIHFTNAIAVGGTRPIIPADFNNDGRLDLLAGQVVYLQHASGSFVYTMTLSNAPTWSVEENALADDFNNDGNVDLLHVTNVWLGAGDGTFTLHSTVPAFAFSSQYHHVRSADFNGDNKVDLVTFSPYVLQVWLGDGAGHFARAATSNYVFTMWGKLGVADFNADGVQDVAFFAGERSETNNVLVFTGKGDGTFTNVTGYPRYGYDRAYLQVADVNLDHRPDVLVSGFYFPEMQVFLGQSNGLAAPRSTARQSGNGAFALADVNRDGFVDQIVTAQVSATGSGVFVALGKGDGTFTNQPPVALPLMFAPGNVVTGDYNGDGKPDLFVGSDQYVMVLTNYSDEAVAPMRLIGFTNSHPVLELTVAAKAQHTLEVSQDLQTWTNLATLLRPENEVIRVADTNSTGVPHRFYRVAR